MRRRSQILISLLLIDKIVIKETDEIGDYNRPKLNIEVVWHAPFINI